MTVSEKVSLHYGRDFQKQQWIFVSFLDNLIWNTFYQNNCDHLRASQHVLRAKAHGGVLQYITWKGTAWNQQSLLKISVMGCCSEMFSSMTFLSCRGNLEQKNLHWLRPVPLLCPVLHGKVWFSSQWVWLPWQHLFFWCNYQKIRLDSVNNYYSTASEVKFTCGLIMENYLIRKALVF